MSAAPYEYEGQFETEYGIPSGATLYVDGKVLDFIDTMVEHFTGDPLDKPIEGRVRIRVELLGEEESE